MYFFKHGPMAIFLLILVCILLKGPNQKIMFSFIPTWPYPFFRTEPRQFYGVLVFVLFSRFVSTYRDRTKERGLRTRFVLVCIAKGTKSKEKASMA